MSGHDSAHRKTLTLFQKVQIDGNDPVSFAITIRDIAEAIADGMGWGAPESTVALLLGGVMTFRDNVKSELPPHLPASVIRMLEDMWQTLASIERELDDEEDDEADGGGRTH